LALTLLLRLRASTTCAVNLGAISSAPSTSGPIPH